MKITYPVFEYRKPPRRISKDFIVGFLWVFSLLLFWALDTRFHVDVRNSWFTTVYLSLIAGISFFWFITGYQDYEPLDGEMNGFIEFDEEAFSVNGSKYLLHDLVSFDLHAPDYRGRNKRGSRTGFSPALSQGVDNYIAFMDANGTLHKTWFRLEEKDQYKELDHFITMAIRLGKISFLRGIELLRITDYDEIQAFKNRLAGMN